MSEQVSKSWKIFKSKFKELYKDVNPEILDYIAVEDILLNHLCGISLDRILETYQLSEEYVTMVLKEFIGLSPRKFGLDFNPYNVYKNVAIGQDKFIEIIESKEIEEDSKALYSACIVFEDISKSIDDFYLKH